MAGSTFGTIFKIMTWGESHGKGIGVTIDGCPAGLPLDEHDIQIYLDLMFCLWMNMISRFIWIGENRDRASSRRPARRAMRLRSCPAFLKGRRPVHRFP
jgi:hypothetical protein